MKPYKEYMDNITVPGPLHQKLVSCSAVKSQASAAGESLSRDTGNSTLHDMISSPAHGGNRRKSRIAAIRRYAAAFACLAVVLACIYTAPHLWKKQTYLSDSPTTPDPCSPINLYLNLSPNLHLNLRLSLQASLQLSLQMSLQMSLQSDLFPFRRQDPTYLQDPAKLRTICSPMIFHIF